MNILDRVYGHLTTDEVIETAFQLCQNDENDDETHKAIALLMIEIAYRQYVYNELLDYLGNFGVEEPPVIHNKPSLTVLKGGLSE